MQVHVRSRRLRIDEAVREQIARRLDFSLGRFTTHIRRVNVHLLDVNGPRGGEDKVCRIEVRLREGGSVFVDGAGSVLAEAVDRAADRAAQSVSRELKRSRGVGRDLFPPLRLVGANDRLD